MKRLTQEQINLIEKPSQSIFLEGAAGTGKSTVGVERMLYLIQSGVPGHKILVIVPQRTLAEPYSNALDTPGLRSGGVVSVLTIGGLAQRMIDLFWPSIASTAGFQQPDRQPDFLTMETAQYFMAQIVQPMFDEGRFSSITINRNRLYSQLLDTLNKASINNFPHAEIGYRLKSAWTGDPGRLRVYDDVQICVTQFREYCIKNNLLDYSLKIQIFQNNIWNSPKFKRYIIDSYDHLIIDNVEEDTRFTHEIIKQWLPHTNSSIVIFDHNAGYRKFLGADPDSALSLKSYCIEKVAFDRSFVNPERITNLINHLHNIIKLKSAYKSGVDKDKRYLNSINLQHNRYFPQMLDWVSERIQQIIKLDQESPGEIVVIAPFLSDALRFALTNRLKNFGISTRSHRPSRSLYDEPVTQCLFTLTKLAHPMWSARLSKYEVAYALMVAIKDCDLIRAQMISEIAYRFRDGKAALTGFDQIIPDMQERITYLIGNRYEYLQNWINEYTLKNPWELDKFWGVLFGEVLSQPGFGFHEKISAGEIIANLIDSYQNFSSIVHNGIVDSSFNLGLEYIDMVECGVISAQYIRSWHKTEENAVFIAPAYTFLMTNKPVKIQFWLDIGSSGWSERLDQPLTHPYVLSSSWTVGEKWNDDHEVSVAQESLFRLMTGLLRRCKDQIYLCYSDYNEQGYESRGNLLHIIQRLLLMNSN
jgi:hypothetical protein